MASRKELMAAVGQRYRSASGVEKRQILDEFVALTGYHRKHALRVLNHPESCRGKDRRPRSRIYDEAVREALVIMWEAADRICGKRLKAALPMLVDAMERHGHLQMGDELKALLLGVSAATIDRMLAPPRKKTKGNRRRRGSGLIRSQIPVRTFADWDDPLPGFMEVDLVVHNGGDSTGSCVHTLVLTDIASGWTECISLLVREQGLVVEALEVARERLPFALLGIDTDNDGAFVNQSLLTYTREEGLTLTRSRAYRKNDQAWVEQKNGAIVRRMIGHGRLQGLKAAQALSHLYSISRLYVNYFQPSFKLKEKQRHGSKVRKNYHPPATPYQRLLSYEHVGAAQTQALRDVYMALDPLSLLHKIRSAQGALAALTVSGDTPRDPSKEEDLAGFLAQLPTLWKGGEVRATHRKPVKERNWRTREDPFASVWEEVKTWLEAEPDATAKALFFRLMDKYPNTYKTSQLRTLQRRVKDWRRTMARRLIFGVNNDDPSTEHGAESVNGTSRTSAPSAW